MPSTVRANTPKPTWAHEDVIYHVTAIGESAFEGRSDISYLSIPSSITSIGEYAFIGAGAVVTKNVPAYALLVGNPARQMGWMSRYGHRLKFDADGFATCPESGERYQLKDGSCKLIIES